MSGRPHLLFAFDFPPIGGGIARWMSEIALRYPPGELVVCTGRVPGDAASDARFPNPVSRVAVPSRRLRTLWGQVRWAHHAMHLIRRYRPGFSWCDNIRPSSYPANFLARWMGVPYGILVHGSDLFDLRSNIRRSRRKRILARRLLGGASVIVSNSRWTRDLALELLGELALIAPLPRVEVVPLGADPDRFSGPVATETFRREHGLPGGRWLLTVARVEAYKGVDTAIRALGLLAASHRDVRYAVVGEGRYLADLQALARAEGVFDRVHFLSGVPDDTLPQVYAMADVYLGLTRQTERDVEGFGISLLEAQAAGKPVVAGRSGGIGDAVRDGETGVLVDPLNPAEVARAVAEFLENPSKAAAFGEAGRRSVARYHNWDRVVADLYRIGEEARASAVIRRI